MRGARRPERWVSSLRLLLAALLAASGAAAATDTGHVGDRSGAPTAAEPIVFPLGGDETHWLEVQVSAGELVAAVVEPRGVDVALVVVDPAGRETLVVDDVTNFTGAESAFWVAATGGTHRLGVRVAHAGGTGSCRVLIDGPRMPSPADRDRARAAELVAEVRGLLDAPNEQSMQTAASSLETALRLLESADDHRPTAIALLWLAKVALTQGDVATAVAHVERAAALAGSSEDPGLRATTLGIFAELLYFQTRFDEALVRAQESLAAARLAQDRYAEGEALTNVGVILSSLGDHQRSLAHLEPALAVWRELGHRDNEATTLTNIGTAQLMDGDLELAVATLRSALELRLVLDDPLRRSYTLVHIAEALWRSHKPAEAIDYARQAREAARQGGEHRVESASHVLESIVRAEAGEYGPAREHALTALALGRGEPFIEAYARYYRARVELAAGELQAARAYAEQAIAIIETVRGNVRTADLRAAYVSRMREFYDLHVDVLMHLHRQHPGEGFDRLALGVAERGRARSLRELIAESRAQIHTGVDPGLVERERTLRERLSALQDARLRGTATAGGMGVPAEGEHEQVRRELESVEAEIRARSPRYAELTQLASGSFTELQKLLDDDTLLLEYVLGDAAGYLFAVGSKTLDSYPLPPRREIEEAARRAYEALSSPATAAEAALEDLARMLLGPIAGRLGERRLVVVADGALHYVPFAALPDPNGGGPLVVRHEVVGLPSASLLSVLRGSRADRAQPTKTLAVFADPVFSANDERLSRARGGEATWVAPALDASAAVLSRAADTIGLAGGEIPRLPFTRREAQALAALVAPGEALVALDFAAHRARLYAPELSRYRFVHFATHGLMDTAHPELSGVLLSLVDETGKPQPGYVTAAEVFNLRLAADLVVLSGCRTGLGKELRGEGMLGLTRAFLYAGADRVVASLWKVDDAATAVLMPHFYREMLREQAAPPAAALRAAQLALRSQKRFRHPYYWAAFQLQGDWR